MNDADAVEPTVGAMDDLPHTSRPGNLLLYFWLPSGKDEFGFQAMLEAPLFHTMKYRTEESVESTVSTHLTRVLENMTRHGNQVGGLVVGRSQKVEDTAELGLRKLHFGFTYHPMENLLPSFVKPGPMTGAAIFLSNGLYAWVFDVEYRESIEESRLQEFAQNFMRDDFVPRHLDLLFDSDWPTKTEDGKVRPYNGILTYYQQEILFNGLFDGAAHPADFFGREGAQRPEYPVGDVVRSLALYSFRRESAPLWDRRKVYSSRDDAALKRTDLDLAELIRPAAPDAPASREARDRILSRLTYAAMEQFLRVSIPFGIAHYRAGLDHCRTDLVNSRLLTRRDHTSSELRRPSLTKMRGTGEQLAIADIEAYYTLLSGKLPLMEFVGGLIEGLSGSSCPLGAPAESTVMGVEVEQKERTRQWHAWVEARATLREALGQYHRQVNAIRAGLFAVSNHLSMTHADLTLAEIAESRKLSEIESEDQSRSIVVDMRDWDQLALRVGIVGAVLALLQVYFAVGIVVTGRLLDGEIWPEGNAKYIAYGHWLIVIAIVFGGVRFIKSSFEPSPEKDPKRNRPRVCKHVFDFSVQREEINGESPDDFVARLRDGEMIDFVTHRAALKADVVDTFREGAGGASESVKYSLDSQDGEQGVSYLFHVEVERVGKKSYLRDVRLVVRVPIDVRVDVEEGARVVVARCIDQMITSTFSTEQRDEFFKSRFGWDWSAIDKA